MRKFAFTLAEILITLGIVGVIAAMTIPNLIVANEKRSTSTKLKKTYSELMQAIRLAENEYGTSFSFCDYPTCNWEYSKNKEAFEKYLMPFMKVARIYNLSDCNDLTTVYSVNNIKLRKTELACYQLMNGTSLAFSHSNQGGATNVSFWVYTNSDKKKKILGRHVFNFSAYDNGNGYTLGTVVKMRDNSLSRSSLINYCKAAENKAIINIGSQGSVPVSAPCTELIMRDSWTFSGDYPIKFK